jgi:hypothetical protein
MTFMDKFKILKDLYFSKKLDGWVRCHIVILDRNISHDFLETLKLRFPKLPQAYLDFLKLYCDPKLDWFTFYGDGGKGSTSLFKMLELWEQDEIFDFEKNGFCPIGDDAGGDLYCLNEQGEVIMFDSINVEEPPKFIADSFEIFMDECVLGKRYPEMSIEGSTFHQFLKEQGWA